MTRTRWLLVVLLLAAVTTGLSDRSAPEPVPADVSARHRSGDAQLRLQWLGVSTWILSRGPEVVVVDPFFSRPSLWQVFASLLGASLEPDEARIRTVLPELPQTTRFVLVGHAHYDHVMDLGYYLRSPGPRPRYLGSRTALNILRGWNPPSLDFVVADEPPQLGRPVRSGQVVVTPLPSTHAPHFAGLMLMDGEITEPRTSPPKRAGDYTLGRTLMFLIDFLDEQEHIASRLFINGTASDPDVALAIPQALLDQHRVDAAILCVPGWDKVAAYPESLLDRLRPDRVVLSHYDDFFAPYVSGQDPNHGMRFVPFADYDGFVEKLTTVNRHRPKPVAVIEPKTGETICLTC